MGDRTVSARILFVSDDIFFWARVRDAAVSSGREAVRIGDEAAMEAAFREGDVARVIMDLSTRSVDVLRWAEAWKGVSPRPDLVAFGSHVDEAALEAARAAGFDAVMPNSRLHRTLAELLR